MDLVTRIYFIILTLNFASSIEISFKSGVGFVAVEQSSVPNPSEYDDIEQTGSYLFDADINGNDKKRLSLGVLVQHFKSPSSRYFRAHPTFMSCIQRVFKDLQSQDISLMIISGYKTKSDVGNKNGVRERYSRSGTGITLGLKPGVNGDIKDVAKSALKKCPVIFERIQRNIGVMLLGGNYVNIHMTGAQNAAPYFGIDGFNGMTETEFQTWSLSQIDAGFDPIGSPDCTNFNGLDNGQLYPSDVTTANEAIEEIDVPISRDVVEDFSTLVQYQGRNIEFENSKRNAAWCGKPGKPCINCLKKPLGNSLNQRCAVRLMSQRMYNVVTLLQKLARTNNEKLKILKSWDEKYEGHVADFDASSQHTEGRLVTVILSSGTNPDNMKKLSQWAICSKADFVQNNGDHVVIGVKKMFGVSPQKIQFPNIELLRVEPPQVHKSLYTLPKGFDADAEAEFPLMDSNNQLDLSLADNINLDMFVSKDTTIRYFRLNPLIVQCYSFMVYNLNKHNNLGDSKINIDVARGFMSTQEQLLKLDPNDKRYNTMTLGTGFEIRYSSQNSEVKPLHTLVKLAIDYCGPIFHESGQEMGIGIYQDRIFIDIRSNFDVWTKFPEQLPTGYILTSYREDMLQRFEQAVDNKIVDPDNLEEACAQANHPGLQSPGFKHVHPVHVQRQRRAVPDPKTCVPESDTSFCKRTLKQRETQVDNIWQEVTRKWLYRDRKDVKAALDGCFLACGTCLAGSIFEDKQENCNNFLHWVPFELMNEDPGVTNLFPRDVMELRGRACRNGHCIEDAPLFHLVALSVEANYRPDPNQSVENELYPQVENPNPVLEMLTRLYAINAFGTVKFWVRNELDMLALQSPLKVVMLYNKNVTDVEVFVLENSKREAVDGVIQTAIADWSSIGCPKYTREIIAPFKVKPMPNDIGKRSPHSAVREEIITHYNSWESRWANMDI